MKPCMICSQSEGRILTFRALEVRTLPVRDISGEHKVQALGDFHEFCVCEDCAKKRRDRNMKVFGSISKRLAAFGAVGGAGLILILADVLFLRGDRVYLMLGCFAVICCLLGCFQSFHDSKQRRDSLEKMNEEDGLFDSAWELVTEHAPAKDGDVDLTYIPVSKKTLSYKNGDLMIMYHLLPEIAIEAHKRIHA